MKRASSSLSSTMSTENTTVVATETTTNSSSEKNLVSLISSDGQNFQVEEKVAIQALTIKNILDDCCGDSVIPIPNVTGPILTKVIEYCKRHMEDKVDDYNELKEFDKEFVKVDQDMLFDLILAANYLNIPELLDLTSQTVADMIKGRTPEEIRKTFNIINDYTPEEEAEVRRDNAWAFE